MLDHLVRVDDVERFVVEALEWLRKVGFDHTYAAGAGLSSQLRYELYAVAIARSDVLSHCHRPLAPATAEV